MKGKRLIDIYQFYGSYGRPYAARSPQPAARSPQPAARSPQPAARTQIIRNS